MSAETLHLIRQKKAELEQHEKDIEKKNLELKRYTSTSMLRENAAETARAISIIKEEIKYLKGEIQSLQEKANAQIAAEKVAEEAARAAEEARIRVIYEENIRRLEESKQNWIRKYEANKQKYALSEGLYSVLSLVTSKKTYAAELDEAEKQYRELYTRIRPSLRPDDIAKYDIENIRPKDEAVAVAAPAPVEAAIAPVEAAVAPGAVVSPKLTAEEIQSLNERKDSITEELKSLDKPENTLTPIQKARRRAEISQELDKINKQLRRGGYFEDPYKAKYLKYKAKYMALKDRASKNI